MATFEIELAGVEDLEASPADWNGFAPSQANPANAVEYAGLYRALGGVPLFLEAYHGGAKVSQWLVCRRRRRLPLLATLYADCAPQVAEAALSARDELLVAYMAFLKRRLWLRELDLLKYSLVRGLTEVALRRSGFRQIVKYGSYVNDLVDDEALLSAFHDSHRRNTRKAIREGFRYAASLPVAEYLELSRQTYAPFGQGGPAPELIEALRRTLAPPGRALFSAVFVGDDLAAASIILHHGHNSFYLHGASSPDKPRGATTYLHFENMRWLRERGVRHYDFGGARPDADDKSRSIATFKERFGGRLISEYGGVYRWP